MIKIFKQIPEPLQKQILYRLGCGIVILFVTIVLLYYKMDLISVLACVIIIIICLLSAFSLFRRAIIGDYTVICGKCIETKLTAVKKQAKTIVLRTENNSIITIIIKQKLKKINSGSKITVYVATNTPIYEYNGMNMLYSYLALDVKVKEN